MDMKDFSWNWFERSGHPVAYMEYRQVEKAQRKLPSAVQNNTDEHF